MSSNVVNNIPYLRTSRNFPEDLPQLTVEINKSYVDIANAVNNRTISIFPTRTPAITGENWFVFKNQRQGTFRQAYPFTATGGVVSPIPHSITFEDISGFTRIYGTVTDTNGLWYPLPYVDVLSATNQISIVVNSTNIVITQGSGAPFVIASGYVVLEWLSRNAITKVF